MGRLGTGFDPDIGSRTASGWNTFIGRRRRARDLVVTGGGPVSLSPGAGWDVGTGARRGLHTSTGVPQDLVRGERYSPVTDS